MRNARLFVMKQVAMQKYRLRFEHKQAGAGGGPRSADDNDDDSDNFSDVSASDTPSELLAAENTAEYYPDGDDASGAGAAAAAGTVPLNAEGLPMTEQELAEAALDAQHIQKELLFAGDADDRPTVGDVVKLHCTCTLAATGAVIESTRQTRRLPFEFVLGAGAVVRGLDKGVASMSFGERAKFTVSAQYGYGDRGYPPVIPPRAVLVFDVNLIRFWPRPRWQKPLIQVSL
jgi:FK506-binding protein 1